MSESSKIIIIIKPIRWHLHLNFKIAFHLLTLSLGGTHDFIIRMCIFDQFNQAFLYLLKYLGCYYATNFRPGGK